ncbi:MAG: NYN domain-containing protein [Chloroflexota bacterium]
MSSKLALLIDAENISHRNCSEILEKITLYGELLIKRVYGNEQNSSVQKWREIAEANNFEIISPRDLPRTKNSADRKLIMGGLKLLAGGSIDIFCLVSNDGDYVDLCEEIHAEGKQVIWVGNPHASEAFIRACDTFIFIGRGDTPVQPSIESLITSPVKAPVSTPKPPTPPTQTNLRDIRKILTQAFSLAPQNADGWVTLSALGNVLPQVQKGFRPNTYGHATLVKLLQSMSDFVKLKGKGAAMSARLEK